MDKFEFKLKTKQLNKLVAAKDYKTAMEVLETMDWSKSKDVGFLISAADIYETNGRYDEAIDVLLRAYEFSGNGRLITYKLTNLAIKAGNKEEAAAYYEEFVNVAPRDMERYALQYQVAKLNGEPTEKLIAILEKQREVDLDEEWSYELAELYHQAGRGEECVELCDEIMLYYALGHYVEKAGALKQLYQPLTPEQAELFDNPEKFEENLRRTQEEFRDKETIKTVNEHMAEEQEEAPVEESAQEEAFVIDISEEKAPVEEVPQEEMPEEIPADFDFASLVRPLDVMEETEDDLYFTEDGAEEDVPAEEEFVEEEPEEIVPIYEDEPVLYVDDDEWMTEDTPEEIHFEEDFEEELAEEPEEFVEEIHHDIPEVMEDAPAFDELPEIIPPFAVGAKAEPEEMTLAWQEVPEPAEEAEIRKIFSQEPQDFYTDMDEVEPEETWKEEQERMLEETEQAVLSALEEEYEGQVLYADEEDFADESKAEEELEEELPEELEEELQEELEEAEEEFQEELEEAEEEFQEELEEAEEEFQEEETPEDDFPLNLQDELERVLEESEEEAEAEPEAEPEEEPEDDEDDDEDFFEDPEEEEEPEPVKDLMPKKTPHILVRTDYAEEGMKMAIEALKRLPDDVRPKAIAKTSGDKLNRKGIRGSYEQLRNKILIVQGAGALGAEVLGDIRQFITNPDNHCIAVLIDSSEKIGEVCMRDPALAALFTTDYEYYEYSPDELVAHGVDYAAEKGYTFDEMAMLALYAGVEDIISEADGSQWIQTEELVEYAIRKAEKKGFFNRGPKIGKDGKKILKEDYLF